MSASDRRPAAASCPRSFRGPARTIDRDLNAAILDAWIEAPSWAHRRILADSFFMQAWVVNTDRQSERYEFQVLSSLALITRLLAHLGETRIDHPSQAALYRISLDEGWRHAAALWFQRNDGELDRLLDPVDGWPAWAILAVDHLQVVGPDSWAVS